MLNIVILQGRLVADPEMKVTGSGVEVTSARIAVDRDFKDKNGERKADFFPITAWRGTAKFLADWFKKGQMIVVQGQLQNQEWTDKDGNKRITTEIVASNVYFGESKQSGSIPEGFAPVGSEEDPPF